MTQKYFHLSRLGSSKAALLFAALFGDAFISDRAAAQMLNFADLAGITIDAKIVSEQTARSVKGVTTQRVTYGYSLEVGTEERLRFTQTISTTMLDGTTRSRRWKADTVLGKPHAWRDGHAVWVLENNSLTHLRTLTEGGTKSTIGFEGSGSNLSCKVSRDHAPEVGVGKITSGATASGYKIDVLKQKNVSASCRVIRKQT